MRSVYTNRAILFHAKQDLVLFDNSVRCNYSAGTFKQTVLCGEGVAGTVSELTRVMMKQSQLKVSASPDEPVTTRQKILAAATEVFAEHGFREATTRKICAKAMVNVALVNYYFSSKAELYKAVVAALFENTGKTLMTIPDTVSDAASWQRAVRTWVARSLQICAARKPPEIWVARLMALEECVPSDLTHDIEEKFAKPVRQCFLRLLRMGLQNDDPVTLALWASDIQAQCVIYALTKQGWANRFCPQGMSHEEWLKRLEDHICDGIFRRLTYSKDPKNQLA